jgi:hypothetical protein
MEVLVSAGFCFLLMVFCPANDFYLWVNIRRLRLFHSIRSHVALLAASGVLALGCSVASLAKSQDSVGEAQSATAQKKTGTKSRSATAHKKVPSSAANKSANSTAKSTPHAGTASHTTSAKRKRGASRVASSKGKKPRGQQKIESDRVEAIQEALIREHYLTGEASGTWNQTSEDAMRHYQADHGWQSKTVPDSRALIKLGLGPSHDHLLNPESAMTTQPDDPRATSLDPASHSAAPGAPVINVPASDPAPAADPSGPSSPH